MYFITLQTEQDCIDRVKNRVVEGGHDVLDEDIRRRYKKAHKNFLSIAKQLDTVFVFDNSSVKRKLIFASSGTNPIKISKSYSSDFFNQIIEKFQ